MAGTVDSLFGALCTKFSASPASNDVTGGMYHGEMPETTSAPYCVLIHQGMEYLRNTGPAYIEKHTVMFFVCATGSANADAAAKSINDEFDTCNPAEIVFTDPENKCLGCLREGGTITREERRLTGGQVVTTIGTPYTVYVQRSRFRG